MVYSIYCILWWCIHKTGGMAFTESTAMEMRHTWHDVFTEPFVCEMTHGHMRINHMNWDYYMCKGLFNYGNEHQPVARHAGNTLQHIWLQQQHVRKTVTHYNTWLDTLYVENTYDCNTLQYIWLQHTATHCNTYARLQHTATHDLIQCSTCLTCWNTSFTDATDKIRTCTRTCTHTYIHTHTHRHRHRPVVTERAHFVVSSHRKKNYRPLMTDHVQDPFTR